jgi:hypothetical protein
MKIPPTGMYVCLLLVHMLSYVQVLLLGVSKGAGVSWLLDHLGMKPHQSTCTDRAWCCCLLCCFHRCCR